MDRNKYPITWDNTTLHQSVYTYNQQQRARFRFERRRPRFRWIKRMLVWTLVSLIWQIPVYYYFNQEVQKILTPANSSSKTTVEKINFHLTLPVINNPQVSYDNQFLALSSDSKLLIYDFAKQAVIWQTKSQSSPKILAYHWLPDRNYLLVFELGTGVNPAQPEQVSLGIHSIEVNNSQGQIIDQFSCALPLRLQRGQITDVSFSTANNLIYFLDKERNLSNLYEIDIMKHLRLLSSPQEYVDNLAVSPTSGSVYFNVESNQVWQTMAENSNKRVQVASNPLDKVLGLWNNKLFLGTVDKGNLIKIWTLNDNQPSSIRPTYTLFWAGQIPWNNSSVTMVGNSLLVGTKNTIYQINYNQSKVLKENSNYIFPDSGNSIYTFISNTSGTQISQVPA